MRTKGHLLIAKQLSSFYLKQNKQRHIKFFNLGCVEPDYNVSSYLKGWKKGHFKGHNFENSLKYGRRLLSWLVTRKRRGVYFYFNLGKLIHYTVDWFTYTHNQNFKGTLKQHTIYEAKLHIFLQENLSHTVYKNACPDGCSIDILEKLHEEYLKQIPSLENDVTYIFKSINCVMTFVLFK